MRSVMTHQFSQVPKAQIPRSSFDRSHGIKSTFNSGLLIPFYVDECLPGDTFNLKTTAFARLATPTKPFMDNLFMETFFFAVPIRLIWENWQKFNGEQDNPDDSTDFIIPRANTPAGGWPPQSIGDYMGLPTLTDDLLVNSLHFRAYNLIYNEWFRDQNLIDSVQNLTGDGPDSTDAFAVLRRRKRHDYFTSCLPWPQKGDPVGLDLGVVAPVVADGTNAPTFQSIAGGEDVGLLRQDDADSNASFQTNITGAQNVEWNETGLVAQLSQAAVVTINDLRQAFQIQKLLERDARGGTRYTEIVRSHFGVVSPDARLQRPEFLGGGSTMININPVAQTSDILSGGPGGETPQGNLAAYGTVSANGHGFTKSFTEHGHIIGLVNVRADLTYQQGLNRMWSRQGRFDFYWPALSHIGEQAVLLKELYQDGSVNDDTVFGYQERYAEYRYKPSQITSAFRSQAAATLDFWHLSQDFDNAPSLNAAFIQDDPPIDRIIAVQDEPHFLLDCYFNLKCARPMPLYGVPGLIDHF